MKINLTAKPGTTDQVKTGTWRELHYPIVDHEKCIGCDLCNKICPEGICFPTDEKNKAGKIIYEMDLDYCKGCGLCAEICPVKAIAMEDIHQHEKHKNTENTIIKNQENKKTKNQSSSSVANIERI